MPRQDGGLEPVGGGGVQRPELRLDALGRVPIILLDAQGAERGEQLRRLRPALHRVVEHGLDRLSLPRLLQERDISEHEVGIGVRQADRARQALARQLGAAAALVDVGREPQQPDIVRALVQRRAQVEHRGLEVAPLGEDSRPDRQRLGVLGIGLEHLVDQRLGLVEVLVGQSEPRQLQPGLVGGGGIGRGRDHTLEQGLGVVLAAELRVEIGEHRLEGKLRRPALARRLDLGDELGAGGLLAAGLHQEAHQVLHRRDVVGLELLDLAQLALDILRAVLAGVPAGQELVQAGIVGMQADELLQMRAEGGVVLALGQDLQLHEIERQVLRVVGQRLVGERERGVRVAAGELVADEQKLGLGIAGPELERLVGVGQRLLGVAQPVIGDRPRDQGVDIVRIRLVRGIGMGQRLVELAGEKHELGELDARRGVGGVDLDDLLEIVEGGLGIALGQQDLGVFEAGGDEVLVDLQRVAELERRLRGLALLDQIEPALEMLGHALFGAVAAGEPEHGGEQNGREQSVGEPDGEAAGAADHSTLDAGKGSTRVVAEQR